MSAFQAVLVALWAAMTIVFALAAAGDSGPVLERIMRAALMVALVVVLPIVLLWGPS